MDPNATELKISMKMLNSSETAAAKTPTAAPPVDPNTIVQIKQVLNFLPYSCIIEIEPPQDIDWVYYAAIDSTGKKLFYKSEYPIKTLPSFSIQEVPTDEKEIRIVCWPVKDNVIGSPTYYGPFPLNEPFYLGAYDLDVRFEKESDKELFQLVKPIIEKHYGKAAIPGPVKIVEASHDVYLPSTNTINLSSNRRNLIHELIHASRKQVLFANKEFKFNEETELIEEFFAEGVANMVKDELNKTNPDNNHLETGAVYGSTLGYNYDFRITDPSLSTQNLQSTFGGILTLENARYYLGSEAFHKIAIEYFIKTGKYFAKEFNRIYYDHVQKELENPSTEMFYSICEKLIPTVETKPTRQWLKDQRLFGGEFQEGEKIYLDIDDYYTHSEWVGISNINLYTTFANGSDWAHGSKRYNMNGKEVKIELIHFPSGEIEYSQTHRIPAYPNGFGAIKLYFHYKDNSPTVAHFQQYDASINVNSIPIKIKGGLYGIQITSENASRSYYHLMGPEMSEGKDKILIANPYLSDTGETWMRLVHHNRDGKKTVVAPQKATNNICAFDVPFIQNKNCEPGILQIQVTSGGFQQNFQRNIGYGSFYGGQQFLIGTESKDFLPLDPIILA